MKLVTARIVETHGDPARSVDVSHARTILELTRRHCKYAIADAPEMIGGHWFCGAPVVKGFCCETHASAVYDGIPEAEQAA